MVEENRDRGRVAGENELQPPGSTGGHAMGAVIQQGDAYDSIVNFVVDEMGFTHIKLRSVSTGIISGKFDLACGAIANTLELIRQRKRLSDEDDVVVFSNFSIPVKMLARIGVLRYRRLICLAFFIHSPAWFPLFRQLARLDSPRDYYILFTEHEKELYARQLGIDPSRLMFLPYGDWSTEQDGVPRESTTAPKPGRYYFAGGYSNRDYPALIKAFREIPADLLIVCSKLNKDVVDESLPPNIRVLRDISSDDFEAFVREAKACIIPLKNDTGAAGQSVMLRLLRNRKVIIASDHGGVREYIIDGESGFLVHDMAEDLPRLIARVETDPHVAELGEAAYARYRQKFSRRATSDALRNLLEQITSAAD
jgi:glycosyltransferase involved in cell wall biosynthesis